MPSVRFALLAACALSGCGAITFDVSQDIPEQTIDGSPLAGVLPAFLDGPQMIDLSEQVQKHDTSVASSADLEQFRFDSTSNATFDFVDSISISIAPADTTSTLPTIEIAHLNPVPKGQTTIELTPDPGVNLLPYIKIDSDITANATGTTPSQSFSFTGHIVITVHI
jgi:hypothetical protein